MAFINSRVTATLLIDIDGLTAEQHAQLQDGVEELIQRVLNPGDQPMALGWTRTTLDMLMRLLHDDGGRDGAVVLREALKHDEGYVSRDRVYKLCHYDAERTLRGFTKPLTRLVKQMKNENLIPEHAIVPLEPRYQDDGGRADGFRTPLELVQLYRGR